MGADRRHGEQAPDQHRSTCVNERELARRHFKEDRWIASKYHVHCRIISLPLEPDDLPAISQHLPAQPALGMLPAHSDSGTIRGLPAQQPLGAGLP